MRHLTRTTLAHFIRVAGTVVDSSHPVVVSDSAVTVTSVILSPVATSHLSLGSLVHRVVPAVMFEPLSLVDSLSPASVLYHVIPQC